MRIGFIGLGSMGRPMAINLLKAGFMLTVFNRSQGSVQTLAALGATPAPSPYAVAEASDVIITMLPAPPDVKSVLLRDDGVLAGTRPGQIIIDHSTIDPASARELAAACAAVGVTFLDAPVSGGPEGATAGTLTIMAGGTREAFDQVTPILSAEGQRLHYIGPSGSGAALKLVNQTLVAIHTAAAAEAMVLGAKAGLDPVTMFEVIRTSYGASRMLERAMTNFILPGELDKGIPMDMLAKDIGLIHGLAETLGTPMQLFDAATQMYAAARSQGHNRRDMAWVILPLEEAAGVTVRAGHRDG